MSTQKRAAKAMNIKMARVKAQMLERMVKSEQMKENGFIVHGEARWETKSAKIGKDDLECKEYEGEPKRPHLYYTAVIADTATTRFIMHIGCGHDLISDKKASELGHPRVEAKDGIQFVTANGITKTHEAMRFTPKEFNVEVGAHILRHTPSVLSVGKKYMEQGFSFLWPREKTPYTTDPHGKVLPLSVRDNIPYIKINDPGDKHARR